jgi:hypothetical protein
LPHWSLSIKIFESKKLIAICDLLALVLANFNKKATGTKTVAF